MFSFRTDLVHAHTSSEPELFDVNDSKKYYPQRLSSPPTSLLSTRDFSDDLVKHDSAYVTNNEKNKELYYNELLTEFDKCSCDSCNNEQDLLELINTAGKNYDDVSKVSHDNEHELSEEIYSSSTYSSELKRNEHSCGGFDTHEFSENQMDDAFTEGLHLSEAFHKCIDKINKLPKRDKIRFSYNKAFNIKL